MAKRSTKPQQPASRPSLGPYLYSVLGGWIALAVAGVVYAHIKSIAAGVAVPIIAAFLLELPLYLAPLFEGSRAAASRIARPLFAFLLAITAVLPYLAYSLPTGSFIGFDFFQLAGLAVTLSFWYIVLPTGVWSDLLFLPIPSAIMIMKLLKQIYRPPLPHLQVDILGHLMLIHVAALAILILGRLTGVKPGLIPTRREAWVGVRAFLLFVPVGFALIWLLRIKMRTAPLSLWYFVPICAGLYLVTGFSEELALRGVVQQHLSRILGNSPGLVIASVLFGLIHLNFGTFPNWNMVALACGAGLFNGWAYQETGSIRASMLTHALTATVWSLWFR